MSFAVLTLIAFLATIFDGFVLSVLWNWFVIPTFTLPILHVWPAVGIMLITSMFKTRIAKDEVTKDGKSHIEKAIENLLTVFVYPLFALALGTLAHWLMS